MFYNRGYLHVSVSIFWVRFRASLGKKCHLDSMDFKILSNLKYHSLPEQALHGIYQGIFYIFRLDNKRLKVVIDSFVVHSLSCIQIFATLWTEARLSCPFSPTVCPNSYPLSQWCHPTISSSGIPFFFCPQSFPTSGSSPRSQLFTSNGQIMGALASASVLPMNSQSWFPLGLTALTSLLSKAPFKHKSLLCYSRSLTQPTFSYWFYLLTDAHLLLTVEEILLCVHSPFTP